MLNDPALIERVAKGELLKWEPLAGAPDRSPRTLLFVPAVFEELYREPWPREPEDRSNLDARERRRSMHAVVARFVGGSLMAPDFEIKLLDPREDPAFANLLEFRSGPPRPQSRLFAYVYRPGTWIAVGFQSRGELGEKGDQRWTDLARQGFAQWSALLPGRAPHAVPYPCNKFASLKAICDD